MVLCRELSKKIQTELAEANSVAEEVLSSMPTVRAHAAEASSRVLYARSLGKFMTLQVILKPSNPPDLGLTLVNKEP